MKYANSRKILWISRLSNPHGPASNIGLDFMDYPGIKERSDLVNPLPLLPLPLIKLMYSFLFFDINEHQARSDQVVPQSPGQEW